VSTFSEKIVRFGASNAGMVGIYTVPGADQLAAERPTVVFWNVGVSHRIGPQRHYVQLSRHLAALNYRSLRFDLGGLGDSQTQAAGNMRLDQEVADIKSALDFLEANGLGHSFVLVGLCSSAASAHPAALSDPRVQGLVMIDGYGYATPMHTVLHTVRRLASPGNIWSRISRVFKSRFKKLNTPNISYFLEFPPKDRVEAEIISMSERGVRFLYIYTGGIQSYYNHAQQFWRMFPLLGKYRSQITAKYFNDVNHLFSYQKNRGTMIQTIEHWLVDTFA